MRIATSFFKIVVLAAIAVIAVTCSTPPPAPSPPPAPVAVASPEQRPDPPPDEWNIFPDPTSGKIDVYHKGEYVGVIDGHEPTQEDPPLPHKTEDPGFDY